MTNELRLRGYHAKTRKAYLGHVKRFAHYYVETPRSLGEIEVRNYVYHLLEKGASHSYVNQCVSALKFPFHRVLKFQHPIENLPRPNKDRYTMLSKFAQKVVQDYRSQYQPQTWLFPGAKPGRHLAERSVQKVFDRTYKNANISRSRKRVILVRR